MRPITTLAPFPPFLPNHTNSTADQTGARFSLLDHLRLLHPPGTRGDVIFSQRRAKWEDTPVPAWQQEAHAADLAGLIDQYVSCHTFYGRRRNGRLAQLGCCWVDLDYYNIPAWQGSDAESVTEQVLATLRRESYPLPSFVLSSGRGLLVMWLHRMVPYQVLPRWKAVQQHLFDGLKEFGPDRNALDPYRVFRLAGTRNGKSGLPVRPVYQHPELWSGKRKTFDALAAAILPKSRDEVVRRLTVRKQRQTGGQPPSRQRLTRETYYTAALEDLKRLVEYRWQGQTPDGERNATLFCVAVVLAHLVPAVQLEQEICSMAHAWAGWSPSRAKSMASSVIHRAKAGAPKGGKNGPYGMRANTAVGWLAISPAEMRDANLRVLITAEVKRERETERKSRSRRAAGVKPRGSYREERARTAASDAATTQATVARCGSLVIAAAELGIAVTALKKRLQRQRRLDTVCPR